jgi:hypothetical protein
MNRAPDWTKEEFELLLQNSALSDESLTARLPRRTVGAIQAVRSGIHEFHQKGETSLLSKMMKKYLRTSGMVLACPICGEKI